MSNWVGYSQAWAGESCALLLTKTLRLEMRERMRNDQRKRMRDTYFAAVEADVANLRRKADILQFPAGVGR